MFGCLVAERSEAPGRVDWGAASLFSLTRWGDRTGYRRAEPSSSRPFRPLGEARNRSGGVGPAYGSLQRTCNTAQLWGHPERSEGSRRRRRFFASLRM